MSFFDTAVNVATLGLAGDGPIKGPPGLSGDPIKMKTANLDPKAQKLLDQTQGRALMSPEEIQKEMTKGVQDEQQRGLIDVPKMADPGTLGGMGMDDALSKRLSRGAENANKFLDILS